MKDKVISNGFVRTFKGTWLNIQEVIEFGILKNPLGKFYIVALGKEHFDSAQISNDLDSENEAQAWLDYIMLQ